VSNVLLSASDVSVERGERQLLSGVSLSVARGELWQLSGANGLGKTSLLRGFAGLARFGIEGDIDAPEPLLYLGHLAANKPLLTPLENLRWHPCGRLQADQSAMLDALTKVGLAGFEDSPLNTLSAGQQRRVALARLWLASEPLWLLDEPFTAVDTAGVELLEQRLMQHVDEGGAVVFTSHQANSFGGRVQVLDLARYACD
jgi:heme exporter protein A